MPGVTSDTKTYDDVMQALKSKNQKAQAPKPGETYTLGDASFTVIAPVKGYGDETNNWSIGMVLQYGENRFLFTGDAEKEAEEDMLAKGEDIPQMYIRHLIMEVRRVPVMIFLIRYILPMR